MGDQEMAFLALNIVLAGYLAYRRILLDLRE